MQNGIQMSSAVAYAVIITLVLLLFYILIKIFKLPVKLISLTAFNLLIGGCALFAANYIFSIFGFSIGVNIVTAAVTGFLGIPGLITLAALNFLI